MAIRNFLSIDVEDYFQVSAFEAVSPHESWDNCPLRVERNIDLILEILEEKNVQATFFILGWIAQRCSSVVKRISAMGHEIASHGQSHRRVTTQSREEFRQDVRESKMLLEDISGQSVRGYRAPSYSISLKTLWAYDELLDAGYTYDSSVFPVRHDFYGIPDWPRFSFDIHRLEDSLWSPWNSKDDFAGTASMKEIPVSTLQIGGKNIPVSGGGYFRFFPYTFTRWGLQKINREEKRPFVFYIHPWELDPHQPRMTGAGWKSHFRHYLNLDKTEIRFRKLLDDFEFGPMQVAFNQEKQQVFQNNQILSWQTPPC